MSKLNRVVVYVPAIEPEHWGGQLPFIPGVPPNDMTEADFNALPERAKYKAIDSGLYRFTEAVSASEEWQSASDDDSPSPSKRAKRGN